MVILPEMTYNYKESLIENLQGIHHQKRTKQFTNRRWGSNSWEKSIKGVNMTKMLHPQSDNVLSKTLLLINTS